jgi:membrane glycosyltransferase
MLLAPTMMLFHTSFVMQTLLGRAVRWNAQDRSDRGVTLREALRRQKYHLLLGLAWGAIMLREAPRFLWWLTPVLAGLVLGVGLTVWTSRRSAGALARRLGLLLIPEETTPPPELGSLGVAPASDAACRPHRRSAHNPLAVRVQVRVRSR